MVAGVWRTEKCPCRSQFWLVEQVEKRRLRLRGFLCLDWLVGSVRCEMGVKDRVDEVAASAWQEPSGLN